MVFFLGTADHHKSHIDLISGTVHALSRKSCSPMPPPFLSYTMGLVATSIGLWPKDKAGPLTGGADKLSRTI